MEYVDDYSLELDDFYEKTNACTDCGFTRDELNQR